MCFCHKSTRFRKKAYLYSGGVSSENTRLISPNPKKKKIKAKLIFFLKKEIELLFGDRLLPRFVPPSGTLNCCRQLLGAQIHSFLSPPVLTSSTSSPITTPGHRLGTITIQSRPEFSPTVVIAEQSA